MANFIHEMLNDLFFSSRIAVNVAPEVGGGFEFGYITYCTNTIRDLDQMNL